MIVQRYFIALIPPPPLYDEALNLKHYFADRYHSRASLNSPPHVTLHMPFDWREDRQQMLIDELSQFGKQQHPFPVSFKGFGSFGARVIYIHVEQDEAIMSFEMKLSRFCRVQLNLFNARYQDRPYHPHLTLAFRDLKKQHHADAWREFQSKDLKHKVQFRSFHLLRHNEKSWIPISEIPLGG